MTRPKFAKEYQIQYGCILDHDTYNFLRVSIESDTESPETKGEVFLNGKPVGTIEYIGKKQFLATRYVGMGKNKMVKVGEFKEMGRATAAIISDFIRP